MSDLVIQEPALPAVQSQGGAVTLLSAIASAASNPAADIDKMERLFAMHQKMVEREAEMAFNASFSRAQARMPIVVAKSRNDQTSSKYAKLAVIVEAIAPVYTAEGFSVSFNNADSPVPGNIRVVATLSHPQGHSRNYQIDMPLDNVGMKGAANKTNVHATGATNSYARRYLTLMIWNLTTEDDTDAQKRPAKGSANEGAGDDLTEDRRKAINAIQAKMVEWINTGSIGDAWLHGENSGLEDVEEIRYLWSLFDSRQRSALKKEGDRVRAALAAPQAGAVDAQPPDSAVISDAQRKRLEGRITGLGYKRDRVKLYVANKFGRAHFSELLQAEYATLDADLENTAFFNESAPPASKPAAAADGPRAETQDGADPITPDQMTDLLDLCDESGMTRAAFLKESGAAKMSAIPRDQYLPLRTRLQAKIAEKTA